MQKSRKQRQNKVWHFFARIAALLVMMGIVAGYTAPAVYAAGSGPIIHWDSTMIYAGQNNGYPWGPVGENTIVHGEKFTPNQQLRLMLVQGDSNTDATICKTSGVSVGTITTDASGTFQQNFAWPASAGQVNQQYSICSLLLADASVVSNQDDGPFTVLSASPPSLSVTPTSLVAGNTVTVTGQNWVPPQQVSINIAGCAACDPGPSEVTNANATSSGLNSGTFSVTITIPATTKPGKYVVDALTQNGLMEAFYTSGVKNITVTAPAPTPTPTQAPSPTVAATQAPTPIPTTSANTNTTTPNSGGNGNSWLMISLFAAIALVIIAIICLVIYVIRQRADKKEEERQAAQFMSQAAPGGFSNGYQPRQPVYPSGPPSQPGQFMQSGTGNGFGQPQGNVGQTAQSRYPGGSVSQPGAFMQPGTGDGFGQYQGMQPNGPFTPHDYNMPTLAAGETPAPGFGPMNPAPGGMQNGFGQHSFANGPVPCPNCGRPVAPNATFCPTCDISWGAPNNQRPW